MSSPDTAKRSELLSLQAARGLAALFVAAHHTFFQPAGDASRSIGLRGFGWGWIGVDLFFCLSGFVMAWVHGGDLGRPEKARAFAFKRFFRIYPPYVLFLLLTLALEAVCLRGHPFYSPAGIVQSLFLLPPQPSLVLVVAWTLSFEALFYVLFCGAILAGPGLARAGAWAWAGLVVLHAFADPRGDDVFGQFLFSPLQLEFLGGIGAALCVRRFRDPGPAIPAAAAIGGLLVVVAGIRLGLWHDWVGEGTLPSLPEKAALALSFSALLFGLARLEIARGFRPPAVLVWLGAASYSIYLLHRNVILWIGYALHHWAGPLFVEPQRPQRIAIAALLAASLLLALGAGFAYHLLVEKPLLRACRAWLARREAGRQDQGPAGPR